MIQRTSASPVRRTVKWTVALIAPIGLAWLCFKLLEPVLIWNYGWQPLPLIEANESLPADAHFVDPQWDRLAAPASQWLHDARARLQTPALSAAISIDGRRVWAGAIGFADIESQRQVNLNSRFRLGSTSKAVTSVAIGTLLDAGRIDLDLQAHHYIADLSAPLANLSTRQAMNHTAGVRNYGLCLCFPLWEHLNRRAFPSTREALRVFEHDALLFPPGTGFSYSSHGYNLAGAVIEAISEDTFLDYLRQAVFQPLQMHHSAGDLADSVVPGYVSFYETDSGFYKTAFDVDNSIKWPSGGLLSTPTDMLALGNAMLSDTLLSAATRDLLLTPQDLADGSPNPQGYALGWRVSDQKKLFDQALSTEIISHHGTAVGSTSYFAALPEFAMVISVMINRGQRNLDALAPEATVLTEIFVAQLQERQRAPQALAQSATAQ